MGESEGSTAKVAGGRRKEETGEGSWRDMGDGGGESGGGKEERGEVMSVRKLYGHCVCSSVSEWLMIMRREKNKWSSNPETLCTVTDIPVRFPEFRNTRLRAIAKLCNPRNPCEHSFVPTPRDQSCCLDFDFDSGCVRENR